MKSIEPGKYGLDVLSHLERKALSRANYGFIYVVGKEGDPDDAPLKVGCTWDLVNRLTGLQNANWQQIKLRGLLCVECEMHPRNSMLLERTAALDEDQVPDLYFMGIGKPHIIDAERIVHRALKQNGLHQSREWFWGGAEKILGIAKEAVRSEFDTSFHDLSGARRLARAYIKEAGLA